mmetsp:Transcript_27078/g.35504  ORF Transcript_27078/g.35504 Transcript_27078/m.35504 type:complete len:81 (+) Transcript_27078:1-243(+)
MSDYIQYAKIIFNPADSIEKRMQDDVKNTIEKYFNYIHHQHQLSHHLEAQLQQASHFERHRGSTTHDEQRDDFDDDIEEF